MDEGFNSAVGMRIRELRTELKYTRERLAEAAEISVQFLSDIESGKKGISAFTLKKLCLALSVSADYIIFGRDTSEELSVAEEMLKTLSSKQLKSVEEILKIIIDATDARR